MSRFILTLSLVFISLFSISDSVLAQEEPNPIFTSYAGFLNELSERRRLNSFFPNEPSALRGLAIGYVNSHDGNLSFIRRDLVTAGRIPIVIGRIYDSSHPDAGEFGGGWFLSLAETISPHPDGALTWRDASGERLTLLPQPLGGWRFSPARPNQVERIEGDGEAELTVVYRNGGRKRFQRTDDIFRLVQIQDAAGNHLNLRYQRAQLTTIVGDNDRWVRLSRNRSGHITAIHDDQGRSVRYHYLGSGILSSTTDLGGHTWAYRYDPAGRLQTVVDPKEQVALSVTYGRDAKVSEAQVRSAVYRYRYRPQITEITDELDRVTRIRHNDYGIAIEIKNRTGLTSTLELDGQHRVTQLKHNGQPRAVIGYGPSGRMATLRRYDEEGAVDLHYTYDWEQRTIEVTGNDTTSLQLDYNAQGQLVERLENDDHIVYRYNAQGDLIHSMDNGESTEYAYNDDGQMTRIENAQGVSRLEYAPNGKLASVTFPDGSVHRYTYNALGFRSRTLRSDRSIVDYDYDVTGNLVNVVYTDPEGQVKSQRIELNDKNQIVQVQFDNGALQVDYDATGQPLVTDLSGERAEYQYDRNGRLVAVMETDQAPLTHSYRPRDIDIRRVLDERTAPVATEGSVHSLIDQRSIWALRTRGSTYGAIGLSPDTFALRLVSAWGMARPDALMTTAKQRQRWRNLTPMALDQRNFDKASNSLFLPPEYHSVNCEVCWFTKPTLEMLGGTTFTAGQTRTIRARTDFYGVCNSVEHNWYVNGNFMATAYGVGEGSDMPLPFPNPGSQQIQTTTECLNCESGPKTSFVLLAQATAPPCIDDIFESHKGFTGFLADRTKFSISHTNNSFNFNLKVFSGTAGMTQPIENAFAAGANQWDVAGQSCGVNYTSNATVSLTTTNINQANMFLRTATGLLGGNDDGCGLWDDDPSRSPRNSITISTHGDCPQSDWPDTAAHEIGHLLRLQHTSIATDIMRSPLAPQSAVRPGHARALIHLYSNF